MEGNISGKIGDNFFIKASGSYLNSLSENDLVMFDFNGNQLNNFNKRGRMELSFHSFLLKNNDINFVSHTPPSNTLKVLCSDRYLEFSNRRIFPDQVIFNGSKSCVVPYAKPGEELTNAVANIVSGLPDSGSVAVSNQLLGKGLYARRKDVRDTLRAIDPDASEKRKGPPIKRVDYDVVIPHDLWHQDGWHKLDKYGIVVHGCIDGATRAIIYAEAADNNRAATVFEIFQRTRNGIIPHRVRGAKGGENFMVRRFMNAVRPPPQIGYIQGRSINNTRIESLWKYVNSQCTRFYIDFFKELRQDHQFADDDVVFLDIETNDHIWVLHYMFLPMINDNLYEWVEGWNLHGLRTEHSDSPL